LKPDFQGYITTLLKLFDNCQRLPSEYECRLVINPDNSARLLFSQRMQFGAVQGECLKTIDLLTCACEVEDEEKVKQHIKYRHRLAQIEFEEIQHKLSQVCEMIQDKNESLVRQLCKQINAQTKLAEGFDAAAVEASKKAPAALSKYSKQSETQRSSTSRKQD
jgi:hypothetical protein